MPLEDFLALYGYKEGEEPTDEECIKEESDAKASESEQPAPPSKLRMLYETIPENGQDVSCLLRFSLGGEEEEDYDCSPGEDEGRKVNTAIMVGSDFPEGLCHFDDALPYESDDKLLWNPYEIPDRLLLPPHPRQVPSLTRSSRYSSAV